NGKSQKKPEGDSISVPLFQNDQKKSRSEPPLGIGNWTPSCRDEDRQKGVSRLSSKGKVVGTSQSKCPIVLLPLWKQPSESSLLSCPNLPSKASRQTEERNSAAIPSLKKN